MIYSTIWSPTPSTLSLKLKEPVQIRDQSLLEAAEQKSIIILFHHQISFAESLKKSRPDLFLILANNERMYTPYELCGYHKIFNLIMDMSFNMDTIKYYPIFGGLLK